VIEVPGYTEQEKIEIAIRHLLPRQRAAVGLKKNQVTLGKKAIQAIIQGWTREAGVRGLERALGSVMRKLAWKAATGEKGPWKVTEADLPTYLGPQRYFHDAVERMKLPGVSMGLAWTPVGGEILFIEASALPGRGQLKLTGSLGDVMKESAVAALTWLRGRGGEFECVNECDFHVHVPAGAVPKDGPSAGVAIVTALASAVTGRPVRYDLAATGEITLRGQVLPVGGIREKILAAARSGVKTVILPKRNEVDLDEVPDEIRKKLTFHLVDQLDQVLDIALHSRRAPGFTGCQPKKKDETTAKTAAASSEPKRAARQAASPRGRK
jgi:ATP-dependent Lon protease